MSGFARLVDTICRGMLWISAMMLTAMMLVVLADVITRALFRLTDGSFDLTFNGGIELVRFALLFAILYALPWCVDRSQVVVDLFTESLSGRKKAFLETVCFCGYTLLAAAMSTKFWNAVGHSSMSGETSQDLMFPMSYIYATTLFGTIMLAVRSLLVAGSRFRIVLGWQA